MKVASPLKYHGGKSPIAGKIRSLFPSDRGDGWLQYVEPFAGGLSVMLADELGGQGISEVINDIDGNLTNFWRVLKDPHEFESLKRRLEATPFSQNEWELACAIINGQIPVLSVDRAWAYFVFCRQSMAGRMNAFSPLSRTRTRRGMNEQVSGWLTAIDGLPEVHRRLSRVAVLNQPAIDVIRKHDDPKSLFYIDAPYVASTRTAPIVYPYEMCDNDHLELVDLLARIRGRAVVSMYRHPIYDALESDHGWNRTDIGVANHSASGYSKRRMVECIWRNYE